jgi:hypothetical protein
MQGFNNANRVAHIAHGIYSGSVPSVGAIPVRNGPMPTQGFGYTPPSIGETQPARNPIINGVRTGIGSFVRPVQSYSFSAGAKSGPSFGTAFKPNIYNVSE